MTCEIRVLCLISTLLTALLPLALTNVTNHKVSVHYKDK